MVTEYSLTLSAGTAEKSRANPLIGIRLEKYQKKLTTGIFKSFLRKLHDVLFTLGAALFQT